MSHDNSNSSASDTPVSQSRLTFLTNLPSYLGQIARTILGTTSRAFNLSFNLRETWPISLLGRTTRVVQLPQASGDDGPLSSQRPSTDSGAFTDQEDRTDELIADVKDPRKGAPEPSLTAVDPVHGAHTKPLMACLNIVDHLHKPSP
ncbi:hypothetical protein TREMEDRAFT_61578 [Tremella mesenterica DSM 1558]|uniref:uncharacterized protein n=1 Tax=Tremella mesenterica (strain ATCC 24925 / CBS 8224 / DSM 1558 / NBRC 9311 / NRRL Y-6157 / RJB 2259-6 / UBC 559-6) TaxID=578456 RepID=UPI0003F49378|nr:uncharacterized protein TREMEDRAFT_61578 [Tremella mesenterica DSM 1558]EIW69809.1 hypothetical protein TREMEDRAFT_61578 [Tremella mesenterica DSM 1558]